MQVPNSDTSVIVSWDQITVLANITGYTVYFSKLVDGVMQSEMSSERVPSTENSHHHHWL